MENPYLIRQVHIKNKPTWLLQLQGRVIGIYPSKVEADRGAVLDQRSRRRSMKLKVMFNFEGEIDLEGATLDDFIENLKSDGVVGIPDKDEIKDALQSLVEDDPTDILPDPVDLLKTMEILEVVDAPEIEGENDEDSEAEAEEALAEDKADHDHKSNKAEDVG